MKIRTADRNDVAALTACIRSGFREVADHFGLDEYNCPSHPSLCREAWIHREMDKGITYYCLEEKGKLIGCAALEDAGGKIGYLERLSVVPGRRNEGLGILLVNHICEAARVRGITRVSIAMIAEHEELCAWYQRRGFMKSRWHHYDHLPFNVQFMEKEI